MVSRSEGISTSKHYEYRQSSPFVPLPEDAYGGGWDITVSVVSVSVTKTTLTKTWNVRVVGRTTGAVYVNENVSITLPPFNGLDEPVGPYWHDIQSHTV